MCCVLSRSALAVVFFFLCGKAEGGTSSPDAPDPVADSLASRVMQAYGGTTAWEALPYLEFDFSVQHAHSRVRVIRHLWSLSNGDYRMELPGPADEPYVVLFNTETRKGTVYWNGTEVDEKERDRQLENAYQRFVRDSYWLVAPFRLFDPGVQRHYLPDSSSATHDVLHLVHEKTGDVYWLYVDKTTGLLSQWSYLLKGEKDLRTFKWQANEEHETPAGPLVFSTQKLALGRSFVIRTDGLSLPATVPDDIFTDSAPRLSDL